MVGPYNTPIALAREPMTAAFMVLCAPFLLNFIIFGLAKATLPGLPLPEGAPLTQDYIGLVTLLGLIAVALHFGLMSIWSNWLGAGPFGGVMRASNNWIWIGVIIGPMILVVPSVLAGMVMAGQEDWAYAEDFDPAWLAKENWTLATIFGAVFLSPIVEEVTYRGIAMGAMLARGINPAVASIIASALFAIIHMQYSPLAIGVVFVAGLGFSALRVLSGTVVVPIAAHIAANSVVIFLQS